MSDNENSTSADFKVLLAQCAERSKKQAKLAEATRRAYVAISEAKMMLFAQQGSGVEFGDIVQLSKDRDAVLRIDADGHLQQQQVSGDDTSLTKNVAAAYREVLRAALDLV